MKASEARKLSEEKSLKFSELLEGIERQAQLGDTCYYTPPNRPISVQFIADLVGLGYSIKEHIDPISGFKMTIISW